MSLPRLSMLLFASAALCSCAVSYTHLDVYKRQSLSIALGTENIGQDTQASGAVISNGSGTGSDPNLSIAGEGLTLDLSNDAVVNLLLAQFMNGVSTMINDGNLSGASRAMAAAAGSTVNALGTDVYKRQQ